MRGAVVCCVVILLSLSLASASVIKGELWLNVQNSCATNPLLIGKAHSISLSCSDAVGDAKDA